MNILPKIEALAAEQGTNRSDIIKDILYAKSDYEPNVRPQNQIKKDYIAEKNEENESGYRYIAVNFGLEFPICYSAIIFLTNQ